MHCYPTKITFRLYYFPLALKTLPPYHIGVNIGIKLFDLIYRYNRDIKPSKDIGLFALHNTHF